jgi:hypothetical protein
MTLARIALMLVLSFAFVEPPQSPLPDVTTPDALGANFDPTAIGKGTPGDFDFLIGTWTFRFQQRGEGGVFRPAQPGEWNTRKAHDGFVVEDVWRLGTSTNPTITYRVFNQAKQIWELQGSHPRTGGWDTGIAWSRADERYLVQHFNDGKLLVRIKYYEITPTSFRWRADGSGDEGKTWTPDIWKMEAARKSQ